MKIAITGSQGFLGQHAIEVARELGHEVVGLTRHEDFLNSEIQPDVAYYGDITDKEYVEKAISQVQGVINLAGILGTQETVDNPYPSVYTNIVGALNVLEAVRRYKIPVVQIAVGNHFMNNSYSITKTTAERFTLMYANEHGVKGNVVRALNAFGERQKFYPVRKMMPYFIHQALNNEDIQIYGSGEQVMDFVYVKDVAHILIEVLTSNSFGNVFEAGLGHGLTVNQWAEAVIDLSHSKSRITHLPMRPGEPEKSKVVAENPYNFAYTDAQEALNQTITWYRNDRKN